MGRKTQYIGLKYEARRFVKDFNIINLDNKTQGMFDEDVPLGMWKDSDGNEYKEVVQCEHWSSGPMIFTQLQKNNDELLFTWKDDEM